MPRSERYGALNTCFPASPSLLAVPASVSSGDQSRLSSEPALQFLLVDSCVCLFRRGLCSTSSPKHTLLDCGCSSTCRTGKGFHTLFCRGLVIILVIIVAQAVGRRGLRQRLCVSRVRGSLRVPQYSSLRP